MAGSLTLLLGAWSSGCGGTPWTNQSAHRSVLECAHGDAACEGCHPAGQPLEPVSEVCSECHLVDRPSSHDPETTGTCEGCHVDACGWGAPSPHPPGFEDPGAHGIATNLQDPAQGDCRSCHGQDLRGGSASGCDDCHAGSGHADWRTDCTYCHGTSGVSGAPPEDLDGQADPSRITFRAHLAHVLPGPEFLPLACSDCHPAPSDALSPGHVFDDTPGAAEVDFGDSVAPSTVWGGIACTNVYCHGKGQAEDGAVSDGLVPLDCDGCHATTARWEAMSGVHALHLGVAAASCHDCHAQVVDAGGAVVGGTHHVDGFRDVSFAEPGVFRDPVAGTCQGTCHAHAHAASPWAVGGSP